MAGIWLGVFCLVDRCRVLMQVGSQSPTLKPVILQEVMEDHRQQIRDLVSCEQQHPQNHAKFFNKYANLINRQVRYSDVFNAAFIIAPTNNILVTYGAL